MYSRTYVCTYKHMYCSASVLRRPSVCVIVFPFPLIDVFFFSALPPPPPPLPLPSSAPPLFYPFPPLSHPPCPSPPLPLPLQVILVLKKELSNTESAEDSETVDVSGYRQLLVQTLHQCSVKFSSVAPSVVPVVSGRGGGGECKHTLAGCATRVCIEWVCQCVCDCRRGSSVYMYVRICVYIHTVYCWSDGLSAVLMCVRLYVCVCLSVNDIIQEEFRIPTHSSLPPPPPPPPQLMDFLSDKDKATACDILTFTREAVQCYPTLQPLVVARLLEVFGQIKVQSGRP